MLTQRFRAGLISFALWVLSCANVQGYIYTTTRKKKQALDCVRSPRVLTPLGMTMLR